MVRAVLCHGTVLCRAVSWEGAVPCSGNVLCCAVPPDGAVPSWGRHSAVPCPVTMLCRDVTWDGAVQCRVLDGAVPCPAVSRDGAVRVLGRCRACSGTVPYRRVYRRPRRVGS